MDCGQKQKLKGVLRFTFKIHNINSIFEGIILYTNRFTKAMIGLRLKRSRCTIFPTYSLNLFTDAAARRRPARRPHTPQSEHIVFKCRRLQNGGKTACRVVFVISRRVWSVSGGGCRTVVTSTEGLMT